MVTGVRMAGGVTSRKMVNAVGTGVIKENCPLKLKDFGGHIAPTESWARGALKLMEWSKRKGITGKIEPSKQFLLEEKLTSQRPIASIIEEHDIPKEHILNLEIKHPCHMFSPSKYTFNPKGAKTVPIKGIDDKRQITDLTFPIMLTVLTFTVSMIGNFLPFQLIYEEKTPRCLPRFDFRPDFNVTFSDNPCRIRKNQSSFSKKLYFRI